MPRPVPPSPPQLPPGPQRAGVPASAARLAPHAPPPHTHSHSPPSSGKPPRSPEEARTRAPASRLQAAPPGLPPPPHSPRSSSSLSRLSLLPARLQRRRCRCRRGEGGGGRSSLRQEVRLPPPAAFMSVFKHRRSEGWPHVPAAASSSCPLLSSAPSRPRSPPDARRRHPASSIPAAGARRAPPAEVR